MEGTTLNIYIGEEHLPKDLKLVVDIDAAFETSAVTDDSVTRDILATIDKAEPVRGNIVRDRFGAQMYASCLSTGTKSLLLAYQNKNIVVDFMEAGDNAKELLPMLPNGNVFFKFKPFNFKSELKHPICCNGIVCNDTEALNYAMLGGTLPNIDEF